MLLIVLFVPMGALRLLVDLVVLKHGETEYG
jgi:hypothetical protein